MNALARNCYRLQAAQEWAIYVIRTSQTRHKQSRTCQESSTIAWPSGFLQGPGGCETSARPICNHPFQNHDRGCLHLQAASNICSMWPVHLRARPSGCPACLSQRHMPPDLWQSAVHAWTVAAGPNACAGPGSLDLHQAGAALRTTATEDPRLLHSAVR